MKAPLNVRFHSKYSPEPNTGCWIWTGSDNYRYGLIASNGRQMKAHRVSYELHHGSIPAGMVVMHQCDNPLCVNPAHLKLGTQLDNIKDRDRKGRQVPSRPTGQLNGMSKLSVSAVQSIKSLAEAGSLHSDLAVLFGVSRTCVSFISSGKRWAHV